MPETNSYWKSEYESIPDFCPCFGLCYYEQLTITGDTLLGDHVYHKVDKSLLLMLDNCDESYSYKGYVGAFRNEVNEKKVWYVPAGESEESLLYDFDIEAGDTLSPGYLFDESLNYYVESIDSVLIGTDYRKRYMIRSDINNGALPFEIIEGFGGPNLLAPATNWFCFEEGYIFNCINISDSIIFGGSCDYLTGSRANESDDALLEITPNPTNGIVRILIHSGEGRARNIEIFNMHGTRVISMTSLEEEITADLSPFPAGLYHIRVRSGRNIYSGKIVLK